MHGFGQDEAGVLYALVTNTHSAGSGGIVYRIAAVPEPAGWAMFGPGGLALLMARRWRPVRLA